MCAKLKKKKKKKKKLVKNKLSGYEPAQYWDEWPIRKCVCQIKQS